MTSRERLLLALDNKEADRVPICGYELVGWNMNDWYNQCASYKPLMDMIREKTDCVYMAPLPRAVFRGQKTTAETWKEGNSTFTKTTYHTPKGDLSSLSRRDEDIYTTWTLEHFLKEIDDIDKYLSMDWSQEDIPDLTELAEVQKNLGEKGIVLPSIADPICEGAELFEMSEFLVFAMTDTEKIKSFLDAIHERQMFYLKSVLDAGVRAGVNLSECLFRLCGPEYATPPYLSPEFFALLVTLYVKDAADLIHQYGAKIRFHSHGKIGKVLDEIMKTEPDAIDPLEPPPDGDIELGEVKEKIGEKVCLFGNLELKLLEHGTSDNVRDFVIKSMRQAKKGGGFVIMPTAAPINDPLAPKTLENYRVFIDTALEYGWY